MLEQLCGGPLSPVDWPGSRFSALKPRPHWVISAVSGPMRVLTRPCSHDPLPRKWGLWPSASAVARHHPLRCPLKMQSQRSQQRVGISLGIPRHARLSDALITLEVTFQCHHHRREWRPTQVLFLSINIFVDLTNRQSSSASRGQDSTSLFHVSPSWPAGLDSGSRPIIHSRSSCVHGSPNGTILRVSTSSEQKQVSGGRLDFPCTNFAIISLDIASHGQGGLLSMPSA
ncbi:hypothetical protein CC79DRAFT_564125 [Sarocladium strictum]